MNPESKAIARMITADTRRRSRTGCFTCRARRIKCDEAKPACQRCIRSNLHCDGYEEKRRIEVQRYSLSVLPHQYSDNSNSTAAESGNNIENNHSIKGRKRSASSSPNSTITTNPVASPRDLGLYPIPSIRADGLPLVAYPINPHPAQVPQDRARFILAYHQYLFRTLHVLFPPEDFHFWRERLCERAWETEFVFDAIMALGGMHRAVLMMSKPSDNDRNRGEDWQVIAVRSYTRGLQGLAENLEEAKQNMDLLIGVLILFAYFECYFGNIPAAVRHVHTADHYFLLMRLDESARGREYLGPIESCLKNLKRVCRIVLPFPTVMVSTEYSSSFDAKETTTSATSSPRLPGTTISSTSLLHSLLDLLSKNVEVEELIWSPIKPYWKSISADTIKEFQETLEDWRSGFEGFPDQDLEGMGFKHYRWARLQDLSMPPLPMGRLHSIKLSTQMCHILCLYSFCMGRLLWARAILAGEDKDRDRLELKAYNYFYEQLQLASMVSPSPDIADDDPFLSCEAANMAIGPMLYVTGHCIPDSTWLRWIINRLAYIGREGLFNCKAFAQALEVLYSLEYRRSSSPSSMLTSGSQKFLPATRRITSMLIPELNGTRFVAFYAGPILQHTNEGSGSGNNSPSHSQKSRRVDMLTYCQGTATWPNAGTIFDSEPQVEMNIYDGDGHIGFRSGEKNKELFTTNWLLSQPAVVEWLTWSRNAEFDLNRALQDHINGSCLLPSAKTSS